MIFGLGFTISTTRADLVGTQMVTREDTSARDTVVTMGGVVGGIGLAMLVTGIVLWATSGTSVEPDPGQRLGALPSPPGGIRVVPGGLVF
jgi:hypothetical protein